MKNYIAPKVELLNTQDCIVTSEDVTTGAIVFPWAKPTSEVSEVCSIKENPISTIDAYDI